MTERTHHRKSAIAALVITGVIGAALPAQALWADKGELTTSTFPIGTIAFGTAPELVEVGPSRASALRPDGVHATDQRVLFYDMSAAGGPVYIRVPGLEIAKVLAQQELNDPPVIWKFVADAIAPQSVGLAYQLTAIGQLPQTECTGLGGIPLVGDPQGNCLAAWAENESDWDGRAAVDSLLAYSTLQVYPAGVGDDCGTVIPETDEWSGPALPPIFGSREEPNPDAPNVYLYNADATAAVNPVGPIAPRVISTPGIVDAEPIEHIWCVAIDFINKPDLPYTQQAWAQGVGDDFAEYSAFQSWGAMIAFPPSLPLAGYYVNEFRATGIGVDFTTASDTEVWRGEVYPDARREPDVILRVDPTVLHVDPAYPTPSDERPTR